MILKLRKYQLRRRHRLRILEKNYLFFKDRKENTKGGEYFIIDGKKIKIPGIKN